MNNETIFRYTPRYPNYQIYCGLIKGLQRGRGNIASRLELAMFLANILHDTNGFEVSEDSQFEDVMMDWNVPLFYWEKYIHQIALVGNFETIINAVNGMGASHSDTLQQLQRRLDLYAHVRIILGV